MLLSAIHPWLYHLSVARQRVLRRLQWIFSSNTYCREYREPLPCRIFKHQSLLLRKLGNSDMRLQQNKVVNLKLAAPKLNGIVINPGETFSLWKLIGKPTSRQGYLKGMLLANGEVTEGVGGGLCQLSNLLYWMALHAPLRVVERFHHGFDAFPDSGRTLPFGSGATIFYNYIDLQICNPTEQPFQILVWVEQDHLKGEIRSDRLLEHGYHVLEREHVFLEGEDGKVYRSNKLYVQKYLRSSGQVIEECLLGCNYCEVKYLLPAKAVIPFKEPVNSKLI